MRKRFAFVTALAIASLVASAASAANVQTTGGATISVINKSNTAPSSTTSATPTVVVQTSVSLPANRLVTARFTAESRCISEVTEFNHCIVEIVARNDANGDETPLNPASGGDLAFDSGVLPITTDDLWEANAMERSRRLPAGDYSIRVYFYISEAETMNFRLDDWHFRVEVAE